MCDWYVVSDELIEKINKGGKMVTLEEANELYENGFYITYGDGEMKDFNYLKLERCE